MTAAMTPTLQALDWCGSALGLIGAYTLAFRLSGSRYGWIAFFTANIIYIVLAASLGVHGLLAQQIGFVGSSAIGIYRHFVSRTGDRLEAARDEALRTCSQLAQLPSHHELPADVARLAQRARQLNPSVVRAEPCQESDKRSSPTL